MGGVRLFGRRWAVSTDDFVFSSFTELFLRTLWIIILLIITFVFVERTADCDSIKIYRIFYIGLVSSLVVNLPLTTGLMVTSARGSILRDRHKRLPWVPLFLYAKLFIYVVEMGWVIFGIYWAFYDETNCDWSSVIVVRIMGVGALIVCLFNAVSVVIIFDPLGSDHGGADHVVKTHEVWERRCRILCCGCAPKDRERDAFTRIANLLTDYFVDMDLTPSDIAAGFLLLRQRQEMELPNSGGQLVPTEPHASDDNGPVWYETKTVCYFMKYASACYGWPVYIMMNFCTGCCRLCGLCRCRCCGDKGDADLQIVDDNGCQCNFASVLKITGLPRSQFLYVTFHNDLCESPYYVAVDHEKKVVIVAVRGSLSGSDGLTDMNALVGSLEPEGHPSFVAHGGILQSARYICQRLTEGQVLDKAFARFPDYNLVLCGHSLGAGIVSVLTVLFSARYPNVRAYAYSPPLGLMNQEMSEFCRDFVVSVCVGYDLVSHLSITTMYLLKQQVLEELSNTNQAKYKIVAKGVFRFCCGSWFSPRPRSPSNTDRLLDVQSNDVTYSTVASPHDEERSSGYSDITGRSLSLDQPDMQFAGRMLHIIDVNDSMDHVQVEDDELDVRFVESNDMTSLLHHPEKEHVHSCLGLGQRKFRAVWRNADHFKRIIIHPRMVTDHLPDRVQSALQYLVDSGARTLQVQDIAS